MNASKTIALLRRMRHDYGNHLQIISGYTDLGRPNAVKEYILKIIEEMNQEKKLFELQNPELSLYLYEQMLSLKDMGVILKYKDLNLISGKGLVNNKEPIRTIMSFIANNNIKEETVIEISLNEKTDNIEISLLCSKVAESPLIFYVKE